MAVDTTFRPAGEQTNRSVAVDRALTRRRLVHLLGAGAAGLTLGGAGLSRRAAAAQESTPDPEGSPAAGGDVTIYSGRNENLVGPLIEQFEDDSEINADVRFAGTPELALQILDEGDDTPADLFFSQDAGFLGLLANEGRFQPLPDDILERVDPRYRSEDGLWVGVSGRARVAVYNTDALTEADLPASVLDFTDPKWQGQIGWAPENASFQAFVTALRLIEGEDAARAWLEGIQANDPVAFESNGDIVVAVGRGEIQVGLVNHYYLFEVKAEEGDDFPIANHFFAAGDPGSLINVAGVGVLDGAANAEQALAFVDYLLQSDAQTYFTEETTEYALIEGVPAAEGLPALTDIEAPDLDLNQLEDLQATTDLLIDLGIL